MTCIREVNYNVILFGPINHGELSCSWLLKCCFMLQLNQLGLGCAFLGGCLRQHKCYDSHTWSQEPIWWGLYNLSWKLLVEVMDLLVLNLEEGMGLEPDCKYHHKTLSHLLVLFNVSIFARVGSNKGNVSPLEPRIYTLVRTLWAGITCIYKAVWGSMMWTWMQNVKKRYINSIISKPQHKSAPSIMR